MAASGLIHFQALSVAAADAFLNRGAILQPGYMLLVEEEDPNLARIYIGIGKGVTETPSFNGSELARVIALEGASYATLPITIADVTNLQTSLDLKLNIADVAYTPGVTAVDEGSF